MVLRPSHLVQLLTAQMPISTYLRAGFSYARRNAAKIVLVTAAAGAAIAVTSHLRRQASHVSDTLHRERTSGARKLRAVFLSNSRSICNAFRNLLPKLRTLISITSMVDTAPPLARLRERPADVAEKHALWNDVMVASITHLASSIYLTSLLYSFLSVQMNLLARYYPSDDTPANVHNLLPAGPLSPNSSKRFLDLVLHVVLNDTNVSRAVLRIQRIVRRVSTQLDLTHTPSTHDIDKMFSTILEKSWNDAMMGASVKENSDGCENEMVHNTNNSENATFDCPDEQSDGNVQQNTSLHHISIDNEEDECSLSAMLHEWLFDDLGSLCERSETPSDDVNFAWLIGELLDLCEVLDFNQYVFNNSIIVRNMAMNELWKDIDSNQVTKRPTLARLLARFSSLATSILSVREQTTSTNKNSRNSVNAPEASSSSQQEGEEGGDEVLNDCLSLDRCLAENEIGTYFAASVFLSGEKDAPVQQTTRSNFLQR